MMDEQTFLLCIREIEEVMAKAGYDPCAQFVGYLESGDPSYITRKDDCRAKIQALDQEQLRNYIEKCRRTIIRSI